MQVRKLRNNVICEPINREGVAFLPLLDAEFLRHYDVKTSDAHDSLDSVSTLDQQQEVVGDCFIAFSTLEAARRANLHPRIYRATMNSAERQISLPLGGIIVQ